MFGLDPICKQNVQLLRINLWLQLDPQRVFIDHLFAGSDSLILSPESDSYIHIFRLRTFPAEFTPNTVLQT